MHHFFSVWNGSLLQTVKHASTYRCITHLCVANKIVCTIVFLIFIKCTLSQVPVINEKSQLSMERMNNEQWIMYTYRLWINVYHISDTECLTLEVKLEQRWTIHSFPWTAFVCYQNFSRSLGRGKRSYCALLHVYFCGKPQSYLIFVTSISSGASVKILTKGNFS